MNRLGEIILIVGFALLFITMSILDSENFTKQIVVLSIVSIVLIVIGGLICKIF